MTKNVLEKYKIVPCREQPSAGPDEPVEGAPTSLSGSLSGEEARKACEFIYIYLLPTFIIF